MAIAPWALVVPFVLLCYQFEWIAWRGWMRDAILGGASQFGITVLPIGATAFQFQGTPYAVSIACTSIDAFFGAIPFFLTGRWSSMFRLCACFIAVAAGTVVRQVLGLLLASRGVPWWLAHEAVAGVFYFLLLLYILGERRRAGLVH